MKTSKSELENLIQGFILAYQAEGKSPNTIEWYRNFITRFLRFLQSNSHPTNIHYINKNHIRAFIRYLQTEARTPYKEKPLSQATVQGYVRTLKAFYSWVSREEYSANDKIGMSLEGLNRFTVKLKEVSAHHDIKPEDLYHRLLKELRMLGKDLLDI